MPREGRVAVCVSGRGSNLRALVAAMRRGALGGRIVLVLADRRCSALEFAEAEGLPTALVEPGAHGARDRWDDAVAESLTASEPDLVVLAGFMRVLGIGVLQRFPGRILNVHPSLLPAFPGRHAVRDALDAGVRVVGVTVHLVDESLDAGPIVLQEAVPVLHGDEESTLTERLHAVEHRLLPRGVALALGGALQLRGRRVAIDASGAARLGSPRRALISVSDKEGLTELGAGLAALDFELVSTGGTARALRSAGLLVTDVAAVTGFPEMLDGRVKTLHPRIHAGVLADLRRDDHRAELALASIDPFQLVVANLYPFEAAATRSGVSEDELIEEIDIGGPTLVRAAAKNHASVAIVTEPRDYPRVLGELRERGEVGDALRRELAVTAFRRTAAYDAHIAAVLPARLGAADDSRRDADRFPPQLRLELARVDLLRYGENPHQQAALYRLLDANPAVGTFALGAQLLQGKALSYNNILDAAAATNLARDLTGAACVIVKHTNPCGAAESGDLVMAWERALASDPVSAFGGVVALTRPVDGPVAERLTSIFLELVAAPAFTREAISVLGRKPSLRVVCDPMLGSRPVASVEYRSAAGGLLAVTSDTQPDDPAAWRVVTTRSPDERERPALDFAWRVTRHVKSNAIVLANDGAVVGVGAGQMSRVDSARLAVQKAGPARTRGAVCASDAFFPFADAVDVCIAAGVTAFVQPGGSQRDAEVIAAAEAAGAAMLLTGTRHFRH